MGERNVLKSTCLGCGGNCGAIYEVEDNKIKKVKGDTEHPLTRGFICAKGLAVEDIRSSPERLKHPMKRMGKKGEGKWAQISWDEAIGEIAENLGRVKEEYGAESFAISAGYTGIISGLNPVSGRFLHEFGSPNKLEELNN